MLTGKVPFHELPNDMTVMFSVAEGKCPSQPLSCSGTTGLESLWELLQNCWEGKAEMRPAAPQIVQRLVGPRIGAKTTSSTTDWDTTFTSDFRPLLQAQPLLPSVTEIEAMILAMVSSESQRLFLPCLLLFETPYLATQVSWPLGIYKLVWSRMCKVGPRRTECDP